MNTLQIPERLFPESANIPIKIATLSRSGIRIPINNVNWPDTFPATIPVWAIAAHDGERMYLMYEVKGELLRAVNMRDFEPVWDDSCVEFFVQREGDKQYRNFECNPLGAMTASLRESRETAEKLSDEIDSIVRHSSIRHYYDNGAELSDWELYLEIPKKALGLQPHETLSGQTMKANFYKCGDKTLQPHFISWAPITSPTPDFHLPQFFGQIRFK